MFTASNIHYEVAARSRGLGCGGMGAVHLLARRVGLIEGLDQNLYLLKRHLPYHESDHVLNITYNILAGGVRLEDIEVRRQDEVFLNGLGAEPRGKAILALRGGVCASSIGGNAASPSATVFSSDRRFIR